MGKTSTSLRLLEPGDQAQLKRAHIERSPIAEALNGFEQWQRGELSPNEEWIDWIIDRFEEAQQLLCRSPELHSDNASMAVTIGGWIDEARAKAPVATIARRCDEHLALYDEFLAQLRECRELAEWVDRERAPRHARALCSRLGGTPFAMLMQPSLLLAGAFGPLPASPRRTAYLTISVRNSSGRRSCRRRDRSTRPAGRRPSGSERWRTGSPRRPGQRCCG